MQIREAELTPDTVSHNSVMHACARAGDPRRVEHWYLEMGREDVQANAITRSHFGSRNTAPPKAKPSMMVQSFADVEATGKTQEAQSAAANPIRIPFANETTELTANLNALVKAIAVLEKGVAGGFLQTKATALLRRLVLAKRDMDEVNRQKCRHSLQARRWLRHMAMSMCRRAEASLASSSR